MFRAKNSPCFLIKQGGGKIFAPLTPYILRVFAVICAMKIEFEQTGSKGAFYIDEGGTRLAEMTFTKAGDALLIIDHTDVSDALRGTGAGKKLVAEAVDYARKNKLHILPVCPFAKSVFDKTPEYADVLSK